MAGKLKSLEVGAFGRYTERELMVTVPAKDAVTMAKGVGSSRGQRKPPLVAVVFSFLRKKISVREKMINRKIISAMIISRSLNQL